MTPFRFVVVTTLALGVASCTSPRGTVSPEITRIEYNSCHSAFLTFTPDGWVEGAYFHGDLEFVREVRKQIPKSKVDAIWARVAALPSSFRGLKVEPQPDWKQFLELRISYADGVQAHLAWMWGEHPGAKVEALVQLLTAEGW